MLAHDVHVVVAPPVAQVKQLLLHIVQVNAVLSCE